MKKSEKTTICLLNDSFPPVIDGVANAVVNYANEIQKSGNNAIVLTPSDPNASDEKFTFPVIRYPSLNTTNLFGYRAGYPFSHIAAAELEKQKVDLLHSHCPVASTIMARSLRDVINVPIVFTYHTKFDIDIANAVRGKLVQKAAILALARNVSACDEVWVVSEGAGKNLRSLGYEGDYFVMENGVDVPKARATASEIAAATANYDLGTGPVFLFVGRLMWYKGINIILEALAALNGFNMDFRMVFIGSGMDEVAIKNKVKNLNLDNKCIFTGSIRDRSVLRAWYSRSDLFLFPSTFDTNGLVVREAAACGLGSILVEGSCAAEGVTDGKNGFLIREDAASLAVRLCLLWDNRNKMAEVGACASDTLYMSWETSVKRAQERYNYVIEKFRSGGYPKHEQPMDDFLHLQGELMEGFARIDSLAENIRDIFE